MHMSIFSPYLFSFFWLMYHLTGKKKEEKERWILVFFFFFCCMEDKEEFYMKTLHEIAIVVIVAKTMSIYINMYILFRLLFLPMLFWWSYVYACTGTLLHCRCRSFILFFSLTFFYRSDWRSKWWVLYAVSFSFSYSIPIRVLLCLSCSTLFMFYYYACHMYFLEQCKKKCNSSRYPHAGKR